MGPVAVGHAPVSPGSDLPVAQCCHEAIRGDCRAFGQDYILGSAFSGQTDLAVAETFGRLGYLGPVDGTQLHVRQSVPDDLFGKF